MATLASLFEELDQVDDRLLQLYRKLLDRSKKKYYVNSSVKTASSGRSNSPPFSGIGGENDSWRSF